MSVLDEIVARKRADVARRMEDVPYDALRERAAPTRRRFADALRRPGDRFILECKRASPSEGLIRGNFDIAEIARAYGPFADAVSILTDEPYFRGGPEVLRAARGLLDRPILAKDFIVGPYQVCEARTLGADAVLLMLSVLDDAEYARCAAEARRLSMDVLTEAHGEGEAERAVALGARVIGINNRDLKTLKVDLGVYARLAGHIPADRVLVCESGIQSHGDILDVRAAAGRANAFLVGGALMREARLDLATRRLIYGGVKVCGLTAPEDAAAAYGAGAVFGGLIFAPSPRRADEAQAREIAAASPLPLTGVFVDEEIQNVSRLASDLALAAVQLHGDETPAYAEALRKELPPQCEIWKALRVQSEANQLFIKGSRGLRPLAGFLGEGAEPHAFDRLLLDAYAPTARGGTGRSFDWAALEGLPDRSRFILAGGIDPGNARRASELGCFAIDANSGVESAPGKKDRGKIRDLFRKIRGDA